MNTTAKSYSASFQLGKPLDGAGIGQVVESRREGFLPGDIVSINTTWTEYAVLPAKVGAFKIVNPLNVPLEYFLGPLGMVGATAYHGLLNIGQPKEGNTVFVSGAAGAVGLLVGQIAKLKGCRVVGSAGSDIKVKALVEEFGYDAAFNYKSVTSWPETFKEHFPKGIDVYYDNVGGIQLDTTLLFMNPRGRLVECGMISQYNGKGPGLQNLIQVVGRQLKIEGFIIAAQMADREFMKKFLTDMLTWIKEGKVKYAVNVVDGIENAPLGFVSMLKGGEKLGKQVVKV